MYDIMILLACVTECTSSSSPIHYYAYISGYELERCYSPGRPVDLNSTLESQGTLDFNLVKNVGMCTVLA